jgi:hypothetical protein
VCGLNSAGCGYSTVMCFYGHGDEPSNSIKVGSFLAGRANMSSEH